MLALPRFSFEPRTVRLTVVLFLVSLTAILWPLLNFTGAPRSLPSGPLPLGPAPGSPADLDSASMLFEPNAGQAAPQTRYLAHVPGRTHFFTLSGVVLSLAPSLGMPEDAAQPGPVRAAGDVELRMNFVGASPLAVLSGESPAASRINYFTGSDPSRWSRNIPTYGGILYTGLYSGIDLRYEGTGSELKGTYTVAPGVDPGAIAWRYEGARSVSVDRAGNLLILVDAEKTGAAAQEPLELTEHAPVAWQEVEGRRVPVDASYRVQANGDITFDLGAYDPALPLVVDPALTYSSYLGGDWADYGFGIAVGPNGDFYVTGVTDSTNLSRGNAFQPQLRGYYNAYVARFNAVGQPVYITYLGGTGIDGGNDIAVDSDGNAYVTGHVSSSNFPVLNAYQSTLRGTYDAFVTKLNPQGSALLWSTYLGGTGDENSQGSGIWNGSIGIDAQRNVYVTGYTTSQDFPVANAIQPSPSNLLREGFVTKFNANGQSLAWSTYLGGTGHDTPFALDIDASGNTYVAGTTTSQDFPIVNAFQPTLVGVDAFITRINPAGTAIVYSTFFGGNDLHGGDTLRDMAVDSAGNIYFTGYTGSTDFPVSGNAPQPGLTGLMSAFVSKLNYAGTLAYSTYLGGSWLNGGFSIDVDPQGRAAVLGFTQSADFPTADPIFPTLRGSEDAFVTQMSPDGSQYAFSTFLGGSDGAEMQSWGGLAVDNIGNIYVTADTQSSDFPTVNAYQPFRGSVADAFVSRISEFTPTPTPTQPGVPTATPTVCPVGDYTVLATTGAAPVRGTDYVPVSSCVNCIAPIQLPFPVSFYGQTFTEAYASSSGNLQFASQNGLPYNYCLPNPEYSFAIFGYWDEIHTNVGGIYTSITGVAPYRAFNIEWRALGTGIDETIDFTISLFEDGTGRVEITYNEMASHGGSATIGVQYGTGGRSTQYSCNQDKAVSAGTKLTFSLPNCPVPTPNPLTVTPTPVPQCNVQTFTGSIGVNDLMRNGTLDFTNVPSSCPAPKTCPNLYPGEYNYDIYTFSNTTGAAACITVILDGSNCGVSKRYVFSSAYLGTFDPNSACTNYLADSGTSSNSFSGPIQYSFTVPAGATFNVLVEELNEAFGCESYNLTVQGLGACPTGTPAPATSTPASGSGTPTSTAVSTRTGTPAGTATRSATPAASGTPLVTPTSCTVSFTDVPQNSTFYSYITCLACRGVISGYADGTFRPGNLVTRGQLAKIVSVSAGFEETHSEQTFEDVPAGSTFHQFIEQLAEREIIGGYACGSTGEPCIGPGDRPYFRPNSPVTRGQAAKIIASAAGMAPPPAGSRTFEDVPEGSTFYAWVEKMGIEGIMSGYPCGTPGEPCGSENRPYFRTNSQVTRGQASKIVSNTFFPGCRPQRPFRH